MVFEHDDLIDIEAAVDKLLVIGDRLWNSLLYESYYKHQATAPQSQGCERDIAMMAMTTRSPINVFGENTLTG